MKLLLKIKFLQGVITKLSGMLVISVGIYLFKVDSIKNRNRYKMSKVNKKLTIQISERNQERCSGVSGDSQLSLGEKATNMVEDFSFL